MHSKNFTKLSISIMILFIIIGFLRCSGSDPSRFYNLTSADSSELVETLAHSKEVSISLGTVNLPDYLNRQQIVTRKSKNELNIAEYDRWAEPLQLNFKRVLLENLSILIPTDNIALIGIENTSFTNYQITIEVIRFEMNVDSMIIFQARWDISTEEGTNFLLSKNSIYSEHILGVGYSDIAETMSKCIWMLSNEIATEIKQKSLF